MASNEGWNKLCIAITSFISWLAHLLASLFKRSRPLEELPVVMSSSQQTMALLEAFHAEDQVLAVPRLHARQHRRVDANTDPRLIRSATSLVKPKSSRSMPVARDDKLLSNYPAAFRWTAPITRPEDSDWDAMAGVLPLGDNDDKVQSGIGNLGQRRGFKGKPLTVRKWSRSSTFLSLPRGLNFTPRSSSIASLEGAFPSSPRTLASRMRSVSLSVVSWSSGTKTPLLEVTQDLQELYDASDPFASPGDTFFAFMTDTNPGPLDDSACQLGFYRQNGMTRKRSCAGKNAMLQAALHAAFTNARMKTTIYDLSTADIVPARMGVPAVRKNVIDSLIVPEKDSLATANSPTIVLTAPPTVDEIELGGELPDEVDGRQRIEASKVPRPALAAMSATRQPTHVLSVLPAPGSDYGFSNVQIPAFPYAEFPKVVYETCREDAAERRSSLRPLVLPARVASRLSARIAPVPEDGQRLEGVIALLDVI